MQLFQKGIYEWNKDRLADHMNSLQFQYTVSPHFESSVDNVSGFDLSHRSEDASQSTKSVLEKGSD